MHTQPLDEHFKNMLAAVVKITGAGVWLNVGFDDELAACICMIAAENLHHLRIERYIA